jgi:tyrosyl-tRNA synthetase
MSINDELMWRYWTFLTDRTQSQIDAMRAAVASGELHPMKAKKDLARSITADFHSEADADAAAQNWAMQFQQKGLAGDAPEVTISLSAEGLIAPAIGEIGTLLRIAKLLHLAGLAVSTGEATRKLAENAVSINGEKFNGRVLTREALGSAPIVRLGRKSVRVVWTA